MNVRKLLKEVKSFWKENPDYSFLKKVKSTIDIVCCGIGLVDESSKKHVRLLLSKSKKMYIGDRSMFNACYRTFRIPLLKLDVGLRHR